MRIRLLETGVISKIAAGEVIQRPVNVVKELVENSLDAMSTSITVEIKNGGMDYIRVTDNGCGIDAQDALLAFERHATSKIASEHELNSLKTLGFRGEALASIAAVSHVTMISRQENAQSGYTVTVHGGSVVERREIGSPEGTTMVVRNLFYNTPVRRQFLKKASVEAGYIGDLMARMILSNPSVSFRHINNEKVYYHSTGSGDMASAMFCIYGRSLLPALLSVEYEDGYIALSGYVSDLNISRSNRAQQSFFINGRYIRSTMLADAVKEAYGARLPKDKYPVAIINMLIAPSEVDVNVHPSKLSVRFHDEERVKNSLVGAIGNALAKDSGVAKLFPGLAEDKREDSKRPIVAAPESNSLREHMRPIYGSAQARMKEDFRLERPKAPEAVSHKDDILQNEAAGDRETQTRAGGESAGIQQEMELPIHIIGNAYGTYWFVQQGEEVYIVDQHAAHERLNYDKLMKSLDSGGAQQLFAPEIIRLTSERSAILERNRETLERIGFGVEEFGPLTYRINAIPCVLPLSDAESFLIDAIDSLESRSATHIARLETLMLMACKASVKAGDRLSHEEVEQLFEAQNRMGPLTCPHGRPIMLKFTRGELERLFKR